MMPEIVRVVVVGGGYAGVISANRLAGIKANSVIEVTLVDPGVQFTERIRLHQYAAGTQGVPGVTWTKVLHPQVRHLPTRAVRINAENRTIVLADQEPLGFDWLVYAVGSGEQDTPLLSVTNPAAAAVTRKVICNLAAGEAVTVAGSGPTGVEVACAVAVSRPDLAITVVAPSGLAHPVTARPAVARRLQRLDIAVESGMVDPVTGDVITTSGDRRSAAEATIWTVGLTVPALAADSGLPVNRDGRLLVDATLTVPGHERILGAGDAVAPQGAPAAHLRASCASAIPLGAHAAETVLARIAGKAPSVIDIGYRVQCLDLGAGHGHVQTVHPDDAAGRWALTGRAGGWGKEQVCRMTVSWLMKEARNPGSYTWPSGPTMTMS